MSVCVGRWTRASCQALTFTACNYWCNCRWAGEECLTGHRNTVGSTGPEKLCGATNLILLPEPRRLVAQPLFFSAGAVSFSNFFFRFFRLFVSSSLACPLSVFLGGFSNHRTRNSRFNAGGMGVIFMATGLGIFTTGNVALGPSGMGPRCRYSSRLLSKFKCGRLCPEVDCERDTRALTKTCL